MQLAMEVANHGYQWTIGTYTGRHGIARETRLALASLGYRLVTHSKTELGLDGNVLDCDLRLADECYSQRLPSLAEDPDTPIISITGSRPRIPEDPRQLGSIRRPACLQPLYAMLQAALEITPRTTPRVDTELHARCVLSDQRWSGSVLSLSTNGCLLRSDAGLEYGTQVSLQFVLPRQDVITTRARCVSRVGNDAGLVFYDSSMGERETIIHYVVDRLTER